MDVLEAPVPKQLPHPNDGMQYYLELVPEYIKKPEKEEKKRDSGKKKSKGYDLDSDEEHEDGGASKRKDVQKVAVNLAETQLSKF